MKVYLKINLAILIAILLFSCEKQEPENKPENTEPAVYNLDSLALSDYLFNIPTNGDTIFVDYKYNMDFRVQLQGVVIDSVLITINNGYQYPADTTIFETDLFNWGEGIHNIGFRFKTRKPETGEVAYYETGPLHLYVKRNLANDYITISVVDGRLRISWPELDENFTRNFHIERFMGEDFQYNMEFDVYTPFFTDTYYVGEAVEYRISLINTEGNKQDCWYFFKEEEDPEFVLTQDRELGYLVHFESCKYFRNFGQYYLTTGINGNPELLFSSFEIDDTTYIDPNGSFASQVSYWLRVMPLQLPENYNDEDWRIFGHYFGGLYGKPTFAFDRMTLTGLNKIAYTFDGKIFTRDLNTNLMTGTISNPGARYETISSTPAGTYLYAFDHNIYGSPRYFWPTAEITSTPQYTFNSNFNSPLVSDNLIAIMGNGANPSQVALYDIKTGGRIFQTPFSANSHGYCISPNGQYFFVGGTHLKYCSYINSSFNLIWEETTYPKFYQFFGFDPTNNQVCYIWDDQDIFFTKNVDDFSDISSFALPVEEIEDIDYFSRKMMCIIEDHIVIYNLDTGDLLEEIPMDWYYVFGAGRDAFLVGNTIFSNQGVRYDF